MGRVTAAGAMGTTKAPTPARTSMSPRSASVRSASRTTIRLTRSCVASSRSGGRRSPACRRPPTMRSASWSATVPEREARLAGMSSSLAE